MSSSRVPLLKAIVALTLLGTVPASVRLIGFNTYSIGILRVSFAILAFGIFLGIKGELKKIPKKDYRALALIGVLFGTHWLTYFWSIKWASASLGVLSFSSYGIHLAVLGWLFGTSRVSKLDVAGVVLGIVGCFLIFPVYSFESEQTMGVVSGIISGFIYALLPILHQKNSHIPSIVRTFGQFLFGFPIFLLFFQKANWSTEPFDWMIILHLGVFCTIIAHVCWVQASTELSTAALSVVHYLYVPIGVFFSWLLVSEVLTSRMLLGAGLILTGNAFVIWHRARQSRLGAGT